jgi:hypothetical protein
MKRHLLPFTALSMKRVAFTILCCTVLMVFPATAQTVQTIKADPGTNNPPPSGAILDLSGTPIPGGGNSTYQQYTVDFTANIANTAITFAFREDPAFISFSNASVVDTSTQSANLLVNGNFSQGVYTDNGNAFTPVGWTYANEFGASSGGIVAQNCGVGEGGTYGVGPCWYDGAVQAYDAISQTIPTTVGDHYRITFWVADNSGCRTDGGGPSCNFSDVSTNGDTTNTGGNGINVTVYAQGGLPLEQQTVTMPLNAAETDFPFNTPNATTIQRIFYTNSNTNPTGTDMQVTLVPISDAAYQNLVFGTFAQGSKCMPQDFGNGNFRCAGTIVLCRPAGGTGPFTGAQCPPASGPTGHIDVAEKYHTNAFTLPTDVPSAGYLQAKDGALNCNGTTDTSNTCRGLVKMINVTIAEDCCTTGGSPPLHFNSLLVPNYCLGFNIISVDEHNVVGFSSPVDNPGPNPTAPVVNLINSKQAVPIKLTVGALPAACTGGAPFTNLDLVGSTNPATIHSVVLTATNATVCSGNAVFDPTPTTNAAGNSGWQILGNGMYQFNWKPAAPVGSCLAFSVDIGDGVPHTAYFKITK